MLRQLKLLRHLLRHDDVVGLVPTGRVQGDGPGVVLGDRGDETRIESPRERYGYVLVLYLAPDGGHYGPLQILELFRHRRLVSTPRF